MNVFDVCYGGRWMVDDHDVLLQVRYIEVIVLVLVMAKLKLHLPAAGI